MSYLNVDLDTTDTEPLDPLLVAVGEDVVVLTRDVRECSWFLSLELAEVPSEAGAGRADAILARFCDLIEGVCGAARASWDGCTRRAFNLGFASWDAAPRAPRASATSRACLLRRWFGLR